MTWEVVHVNFFTRKPVFTKILKMHEQLNLLRNILFNLLLHCDCSWPESETIEENSPIMNLHALFYQSERMQSDFRFQVLFILYEPKCCNSMHILNAFKSQLKVSSKFVFACLIFVLLIRLFQLYHQVYKVFSVQLR